MQITIIKIKEKIISKEVKPTKFFFQQEKQNQNKKNHKNYSKRTRRIITKKFRNFT